MDFPARHVPAGVALSELSSPASATTVAGLSWWPQGPDPRGAAAWIFCWAGRQHPWQGLQQQKEAAGSLHGVAESSVL